MLMQADDHHHRWYPVTRREELVIRHVVHTQLCGQELALWRDDSGRTNAWENRCPHRGVRLSIGINDGNELRCRYHGWRFASGSGQCTFIPAHPTQKPASTIKALTFPSAEAYGYVWVALADAPVHASGASAAPDGPPLQPHLEHRHITTLRSVFVDAPMGIVEVAMQAAAANPARVHWLQPVDDGHTVIHAAVLDEPSPTGRLALLRHHHAALAQVRDLAEARHRAEVDPRGDR